MLDELKEVAIWIVGGVGTVILGLLKLRRKKSDDDTAIVNNEADRSRIAWLEAQRDKANTERDTYLDGLRRAEIVIERQTGQIERQNVQIQQQAEHNTVLSGENLKLANQLSKFELQIKSMQRLLVSIAPDRASEILSSGFSPLE